MNMEEMTLANRASLGMNPYRITGSWRNPATASIERMSKLLLLVLHDAGRRQLDVAALQLPDHGGRYQLRQRLWDAEVGMLVDVGKGFGDHVTRVIAGCAGHHDRRQEHQRVHGDDRVRDPGVALDRRFVATDWKKNHSGRR